MQNNINIIKRLLEANVDLSKNSSHLTPLMLACKQGNIEISELLLQKSEGSINETNILGDTPLKLAQRFGHENLALLLINKYRALLTRPGSSNNLIKFN